MTAAEWRSRIHAKHLREQREADAALRRPTQRGQDGAERGAGGPLGSEVGPSATTTGNVAQSATGTKGTR